MYEVGSGLPEEELKLLAWGAPQRAPYTRQATPAWWCSTRCSPTTRAAMAARSPCGTPAFSSTAPRLLTTQLAAPVRNHCGVTLCMDLSLT